MEEAAAVQTARPLPGGQWCIYCIGRVGVGREEAGLQAWLSIGKLQV